MHTNKSRLTFEEAIKKVAKIKPEFDKIRDYNKKLEFWYSNGFDIGTLTYSTKDTFEKENALEKKISIYPENTDEIKAFKNFYHRIFHEENFNTLETSKQKYWQFIKDRANPIPLTKNIIAEIDQEYEANNKFKDIGQNSLRSYCNGYDTSENGLIKLFLNDPSFHNNMLSFCTGEVHELYRCFLVEQLHVLETTKQDRFNQDEKLNISHKLIGENTANTIQPVYHHIEPVLYTFNVTPLEAIKILLEKQGSNSPQLNKNAVEPIITYLKRISTLSQQPEIIEHQHFSEQEINYQIRERFELIAYLNQYQSEGIRFDFNIEQHSAISSIQENGSTISFISPYSSNKEVNHEMIERFYQRRWEARKHLFIENDFIEDELKYISTFSENVRKEFEAQFYPWQKFLKEKLSPPKQNKTDVKNIVNYSHKQIAIAYAIMGIIITKENAESILKKHSTFKSIDKLIQKRVSHKISELTKLTEVKTTDTKHLKDLVQVERLISGTKNPKAKTDIKRIIAAFQASYNSKY